MIPSVFCFHLVFVGFLYTKHVLLDVPDFAANVYSTTQT